MPLTNENIPAIASTGQTASIAALPAGALDTLAARLRGAGYFFALLDTQGAPVWHDAAAPQLFTRFLLPMLASPGVAQSSFTEAMAKLTGSSAAQAVGSFPGMVVVIVPQIDKKQLSGALLLAGKSEAFTLNDDVLSEATRLGLDAGWLAQQAVALPPATGASVITMVRLIPPMLRDQLRLGASEQEIDSLSTQLANSYEELSLIYQVSGGMTIKKSAAEFFRQACGDCRDVVNVRAMGFALVGDGVIRPEPALVGESGLPADLLPKLADQLIAVLRERKTPLLITNLPADKRFGWLAGFASQLLAVPLQRQDKVLGCLFGLDKNRGEFDSVDIKLLSSIANESAIYLENSMLFEDVRSLMMGVLRSLTSAVDAKDTYTCGHSERVAQISRRLGRELGMPEERVERVYMAGILHDVGKIGVPEAVLHKAGKLTNEEFDQMKKHPQIGAKILADIKQVEDLIPGVLHHHERYDGKGYPHRLSGLAIPEMGRIICIADCFDAMTSNRTYRRALPLEVALIEVRRCAGTQFDPEMAEAFLRINPEEFRTLIREHQARAAAPMTIAEVVTTAKVAA